MTTAGRIRAVARSVPFGAACGGRDQAGSRSRREVTQEDKSVARNVCVAQRQSCPDVAAGRLPALFQPILHPACAPNEARTQDARNGVRQAGSTLVPGYFKLLILNFLKINTKSGARNSLRFSMVRASWGPCGMMGA